MQAAGVAWLVLVIGPGTSVWADPAVRLRVHGDCPTKEQVSAALHYLLIKGFGQAVAPDAAQSDLLLEVVEDGSRYGASLAGQTREYEDPTRDCEDRARVVAVFAAMTLEPPEVEGRARRPPQAEQHQIELGVGVHSDAGLQRTNQAFAWGGELRAALSGRRWGVELGAGGQASAALAWGTYKAKITRFPADISARATFRHGPRVAHLSAGAAFVIFRLRGESPGISVQDGGTRLNLGLRAAISIGLLSDAPIRPFLTLQASVWPKVYAAVVDSVGQVGTIPVVWVGVTVGVAMGSR
jgi:hypothetical protein